MFCRGRYRNSLDWSNDWLIYHCAKQTDNQQTTPAVTVPNLHGHGFQHPHRSATWRLPPPTCWLLSTHMLPCPWYCTSLLVNIQSDQWQHNDLLSSQLMQTEHELPQLNISTTSCKSEGWWHKIKPFVCFNSFTKQDISDYSFIHVFDTWVFYICFSAGLSKRKLFKN